MYSPYRVLNVSSLASLEEIRLAYRELCKKYHPDNLETGDIAKFREVSEAWKYIEKHHKNVATSRGKSVWRHKSLFSIYKEDL